MITKARAWVRTLTFVIKHRRSFEDFVTASNSEGVAWRKPGRWYVQDVERYTSLVSEVAGDFAEVGVFQGQTFRHVVKFASRQGKAAHAFDSFRGMDNPGVLDDRPKGEFDVGGVEGFHALMRKHGYQPNEYHAWPGFIPDCFNEIPTETQFSFVLLDVDNYEPTRLALDWVWPRISPGGVLAMDDFYPSSNREASLAIKQFLRSRDNYQIVDLMNNQLAVSKIFVD